VKRLSYFEDEFVLETTARRGPVLAQAKRQKFLDTPRVSRYMETVTVCSIRETTKFPRALASTGDWRHGAPHEEDCS
jgi:hypothetical protein